MSKRRVFNNVVRKIQEIKSLTRTSALQHLSIKYGVSYSTLHALGKRGKMPTRKSSVNIISEMIKELS